MNGEIGILAAVRALPARTMPLPAIFREEGAGDAAAVAGRLGVQSVHVCESGTGSDLALEAARRALEESGVAPEAIGILVDYSVLPQELLAPAWNMSNRIQSLLGAKGSFTIGFSGAGSTGFLLGLDYALAALETDAALQNVLLLGADVAIPSNRIINRDDPVTVLGDGGSAVVVGRMGQGPKRNRLLRTRIESDGSLHDVCYVPGGGMSHPERDDLYRLQLDAVRFRAAGSQALLARQATEMLRESGAGIGGMKRIVYPNLSAEDRASFSREAGATPAQMSRTTLASTGNVQGNDLAFNLIEVLQGGDLQPGDPVLICSHGLGFTRGCALVEH